MKKLLGVAVVIWFACFGGFAAAETMKQPRGKNWLALTSTPDKDVAIGIARFERGQTDSIRVVRSKNGRYAVVAGPFRARTMMQFRALAMAKDFSNLPKDAMLNDGSRYVKTVWQLSGADSTAMQSYALGKPVQLSAGALSVRVSGEKLSIANAYTSIDGADNKGKFHFDIGKDYVPDEQTSADAMSSEEFYHAAVVKLIADSDTPQIVVTQFSGGAHCCTQTYIASRDATASAWSLIETPPRDGDGFSYEDVDGDGAQELVGVDNAFLYAFDSYAASSAPLQIHKLREGKLVDVTLEPAMHHRLVQDLARMEWEAKVQPEVSKGNGYLAAWVAAKIRLGQGDEAWKVFIRQYDRHSSFGPQFCKSGKSVDNCSGEDLKPIPIPKALAQFLRDNSYGPLPKGAEALLK